MVVPFRKHITSPLRAQQANAIYRFVTIVYYYNYHSYGHYPSLSFIGNKRWIIFVPHRKHIKSPLRAAAAAASDILKFLVI
jgi:hypothetical protein